MSIFGIRITVHPTFFWLLVLPVLLIGGLPLVAWLMVVFSLVVLHELSHALVAKAHGVPVEGITLLPIGGMARLGVMPEDPAIETKIAVAGPLLNFTLAAFVLLLAKTASLPLMARQTNGESAFLAATFLGKLFVVNLALGMFNLLPAFPMDGGRLLRAFLARRRDYLSATRIAARTGRWIAAGMAGYAVFSLFSPTLPGTLWLIVIAVFIYLAGKREEMMVAARRAAGGFWRLFGVPPPHAAPPEDFRSPEQPDEPGDRPEVIDIEGRTINDESRASPADAFRRLANDIDTHLRR
ncbi:MAG: site-2 protease family protein [Planctomycetota bacterium]